MSSPKPIAWGDLPAYWSILSESDKQGYLELRRVIEPLTTRGDREQLHPRFRVILSRIYMFAVRHDQNDWKRSLVSGIVWLNGLLAMRAR
jgi:hypothetical protein